jgi:hypothetical protein
MCPHSYRNSEDAVPLHPAAARLRSRDIRLLDFASYFNSGDQAGSEAKDGVGIWRSL